jgi:hypothetical protein
VSAAATVIVARDRASPKLQTKPRSRRPAWPPNVRSSRPSRAEDHQRRRNATLDPTKLDVRFVGRRGRAIRA